MRHYFSYAMLILSLTLALGLGETFHDSHHHGDSISLAALHVAEPAQVQRMPVEHASELFSGILSAESSETGSDQAKNSYLMLRSNANPYALHADPGRIC